MDTTKLFKSLVTFVVTISLCVFSVYASPADPDNDEIPGKNGEDYLIVHTENIVLDSYKGSEVGERAMPGYSIRNITSGGGRKPFSISQQGTPGGTIGFSQSASISLSCDTSFGISIDDLSAKLGFAVKSTYTQNLSYSYKIPSNHNGKKVKTAKLTPWLVHDTYYYDFYYLESKTGRGKTEKPKMIDYVVTFTYY